MVMVLEYRCKRRTAYSFLLFENSLLLSSSSTETDTITYCKDLPIKPIKLKTPVSCKILIATITVLQLLLPNLSQNKYAQIPDKKRCIGEYLINTCRPRAFSVIVVLVMVFFPLPFVEVAVQVA